MEGGFLVLGLKPALRALLGGQQALPRGVSALLTFHRNNTGFPTATFTWVQTNCSCHYNLLHILKSSTPDFFFPTPRLHIFSYVQAKIGIFLTTEQ